MSEGVGVGVGTCVGVGVGLDVRHTHVHSPIHVCTRFYNGYVVIVLDVCAAL